MMVDAFPAVANAVLVLLASVGACAFVAGIVETVTGNGAAILVMAAAVAVTGLAFHLAVI